MRKSGLHKQISSIFDGVPVPSNDVVSDNTETSEVLTESPVQDVPAADVPQKTTTAPSAGPSLMQRINADPSESIADTTESDPIPVVQVGRPMPLPKSKVMTKAANGPSLAAQAKKAIFGSQSAIDPRQKKAAVLVGILSVVFAGVLFVSLGGVGAKKVTAAQTASSDESTQSHAPQKTAQNWESPAPLPQDLRNVTSPVIVRSGGQQTDEASGSSALIVKGIVFSKNKPSAIINNEILTEGQTFNGVTITKITKDTVEFEADQRRWTQGVQR